MGRAMPKGMLAAGMKFLVDRLETVAIDMGIDLGGGNIGMAQHHLHGPEIGIMGQEMRGKGVAQYMG